MEHVGVNESIFVFGHRYYFVVAAGTDPSGLSREIRSFFLPLGEKISAKLNTLN